MTIALDLPSTNLSDLFVVQRGNFEADGIVRERGEVLNVSGWRNYQALVNSRYLVGAPYDLLDHIVDCECGRRWKDSESASAHPCPARKD